MQTAKTEVISDGLHNGIHEIHIRIYLGDYENTFGICVVKVKNGVAEIYKMQIPETQRRKHYGSKLWKFAEKYVIKKYHPNRFIGELDLSNVAAVEFWKSHNFQIKHQEPDFGFVVKEVDARAHIASRNIHV